MLSILTQSKQVFHSLEEEITKRIPSYQQGKKRIHTVDKSYPQIVDIKKNPFRTKGLCCFFLVEKGDFIF